MLEFSGNPETWIAMLWEKLWHLETDHTYVDRIWVNIADRVSPTFANSIHANIEYLEVK